MAAGNTTQTRRILFARIGRMHNYAGPVPGDDRPVGGGGYNKTKVGHEIYNFKAFRGRLYGYFQPNMASQKVALERIALEAADEEVLKDVLLIFISRLKKGGQVIVGWYDHAEITRELVKHSPGKPRKYGHFAVARVDNCVLLPEENRRCQIPNGKGGTGQSNVCYPLRRKGLPKNAPWMRRAVEFVRDYQGPNLLVEPEADAEAESADAVERAVARAKGQGFARTPEQRRVLEEYSMKVARRYYRRLGYSVEDVSKQRSYDLECRRRNRVLHVEVKGTMTDGRSIVLTNNEVKHACDGKNKCALFILHSVKLKGLKASGGKQIVTDPWYLNRSGLTPVSYTYRI